MPVTLVPLAWISVRFDVALTSNASVDVTCMVDAPERDVSIETTQCWPNASTGRLSMVFKMSDVDRSRLFGACGVSESDWKSKLMRHIGAGVAQQILFEPPHDGGTLKVAPPGRSCGMIVGPFAER